MRNYQDSAPRIVILSILLLCFVLTLCSKSYGQDKEKFLGTWKYELNHKIDFHDVMRVAHSFNFDTTNTSERTLLNYGLASVVISRCESSELMISPFENQAMITIKNYNDPRQEVIEWGSWKKIDNYTYELYFEKRKEKYVYNALTEEFFYNANEDAINYISFLLHQNMKLVKKGD